MFLGIRYIPLIEQFVFLWLKKEEEEEEEEALHILITSSKLYQGLSWLLLTAAGYL